MMNDDSIQDFIESIPKVELHAHLNGCIREDTLFELAEQRGVTLPNYHFFACTSTTNHQHINERPRSLQDCFSMFQEIPKCVNDLVALKRVTRETLEDFASHQLAYFELRSTPKRLLYDYENNRGVCSKREYIEAIVEVLESFERQEQERFELEKLNAARRCRLPLVPRFIVSVDRSSTVEDAMEHVQLALDLAQSGNEYVVGVDLGGNPTKNDFRDFESAFRSAREGGLKVTIHCGEVPCSESVSDSNDELSRAFQEAEAVIRFRPDRLGHALLLPDSLELVLDKERIPIETCPTSNVMTLELATSFRGDLIKGVKCHPRLRHWLDTKYPISVSTDDSGVFHTDSTKELLLVTIAYNLNRQDLRQIVLQSMDHAFCDEATKIQLKKAIEDRCKLLMPS